MKTNRPLAERFWKKVAKSDGCWMWTASSHDGRYGQFATGNGKNVAAHRFAFSLAYGPIPEGLCVCHRCDTTMCVRPDHLFLGNIYAGVLDRRLAEIELAFVDRIAECVS